MIALLEPQPLAPEQLSALLMIAVIFATRGRVLGLFPPLFSLPFSTDVRLSAHAVALPRRTVVVAYRASDTGDLAGRRVGPLAVLGPNNRWPARGVLLVRVLFGRAPCVADPLETPLLGARARTLALLTGISSGALRDRRTSGCP